MRLALFLLAVGAIAQTVSPGGGSGGGAPSGAAGGVLSGTYPNPGLANPITGNLAVTGTITAGSGSGPGVIKLPGSSTGAASITTALSGASSYTYTMPSTSTNDTFCFVALANCGVSGLTNNCIVTGNSGGGAQTNTNCPTTDPNGNVTFGGSSGNTETLNIGGNANGNAELIMTIPGSGGQGFVVNLNGGTATRAYNPNSNGMYLGFTGTGPTEIDGSALFMQGAAATGTGDVTQCWNATSHAWTQGAICGTSLGRYKTNIDTKVHGLDYVLKMRPVTFAWRDDGHPDLGLIADDVAAIDPLLGAYDADGSLYNFRDRPVLATAIKAIQELEAQIKELQRERKPWWKRIF